MGQVLQTTGHAEILQHPQILQLAQGSPGAAIAHWQQLQAIPPELLQTVSQLPQSQREALHLARQIDQLVEPEAQLWLIDYLQQSYWQQHQANGANSLSYSLKPLQLLEKAREYLKEIKVNPRLVWEVTLIGMVT
jgi:DNA polymerase-3 subunit delta'